MSVGEIAGLIAAIAFAVLSGVLIYPLIRLGKMFDQIANTVKAVSYTHLTLPTNREV